jgi:DNA-binding NarL/FixJ family response regulator
MDVITGAAVLPLAVGLALGASSLSNQHITLVLVIAGISILLLTTTRRRIRRAQNSPQAYAREQLSRLRSERSLVADIEELMAELEQFSRQMQARLDTKFAKLETAIRDADQRIDQLDRLLRRAEGEPTVDVTVGGSEPAAESPPAAADGDRHQAVYQLADAGLTPAQIAQELGQSIGEVELIVALRKASSSAPAPA